MTRPSGRRPGFPLHWAQVGVYLILLKEETGIRPQHGYVVLGDGQCHRVENTHELRARVSAFAGQIRTEPRNPDQPIPLRQ